MLELNHLSLSCMETSMKRSAFRVLCFLTILTSCLGVRAQSVNVADDIQLTGTLGTKLKIEMILKTEKGIPFFSTKERDCIEVQGEYAYRTQVIPITLNGRICPSDGSVLLRVGNEQDEQERFEGKWSPSSKQIKGTWTLNKTGKTMPFNLLALETSASSIQIEGFLKILNGQMQIESHVEGARIEEAAWDGREAKILGFQPNWGGDISAFSPTRLEFYTYYNSTGRSSDYEEVYQLLPSPSGTFVARLFTYSGFEKSEDEEGNMLVSDGICGGELQVFQFVNDEVIEVSEDRVPADSRVFEESASGCVAHIMSTAVYTPDGAKLNWDGLKFVK